MSDNDHDIAGQEGAKQQKANGKVEVFTVINISYLVLRKYERRLDNEDNPREE